jgi:hypothetical protein
MDKEQKRLRLSQIREEEEKIRQKILYHRRQIDKFTTYEFEFFHFDTLEWSKKRLQHRHKIGILMNDEETLERERMRILHGE